MQWLAPSDRRIETHDVLLHGTVESASLLTTPTKAGGDLPSPSPAGSLAARRADPAPIRYSDHTTATAAA